jgi:hypothetical protein
MLHQKENTQLRDVSEVLLFRAINMTDSQHTNEYATDEPSDCAEAKMEDKSVCPRTKCSEPGEKGVKRNAPCRGEDAQTGDLLRHPGRSPIPLLDGDAAKYSSTHRPQYGELLYGCLYKEGSFCQPYNHPFD